MPIKFENVGIAVRDLEATVAFFTDLGLTVVGRVCRVPVDITEERRQGSSSRINRGK
jgi:catechol 2,3-dioxygenase-like lactoylglutathione lyase family enzyme